jgi:hypothetical protein
MLADRTAQFADEVLDLIDDFVPGAKTRIIAEQLIRSATSTAANYRAAQRARSRAEFSFFTPALPDRRPERADFSLSAGIPRSRLDFVLLEGR